MSRPLRLDHPGAHHHIYNRGSRSSALFLDDEDCVAFLALLARLPERFGLEVQAYALMTNHFHLLLHSRRGRLASGMQYLQGEYAAHFNARHGLQGPLYTGRYANRLVEDDAWWAHLLAYVHLNPVKARLVSGPGRGVLDEPRGLPGPGDAAGVALQGRAPGVAWGAGGRGRICAGGADRARAGAGGLRSGGLGGSFAGRLGAEAGARAHRDDGQPGAGFAEVAAVVGLPVNALRQAGRGRSAG